ncbi:hypothetical protein HMPREF1985_01879 [Mitsuokella sp. oral taxon 131 str. W9106]|nr:hypothetical protein HMPREF1985_01879 [Mitsuokella sp. oral taxon 131 str. W9106]
MRPNGENGEPVDPGLYVPGLLALEQEQGGGLGLDFHGHTKDWVVTNDFAKPISDLVNSIVEVITTGLELLQGYVAKIFFVLVAIDLALGGMGKAMTPTSEDREGLFKWLVRRGLFYGFCLVPLYNWGNLSAIWHSMDSPRSGLSRAAICRQRRRQSPTRRRSCRRA